MKLAKPDLNHVPPSHHWEFKSFMPGARFIRIVDHEKSVDPSTGRPRYSPTDFNPTLVLDKPHVRGRFSARRHRDRSERYSYLYLGELVKDERLALLECIDVLSLGRTENDGYRLLDEASVQNLSFAYITLKRATTLLDISTEPFAGVFKANLDTLGGRNHRMTRRWARYFRKVAPHVDGLYYRPAKYGTDASGGNVVLFAEHEQNGDMIEAEHTTVKLTEKAGVARLVALGKDLRLAYTGGVA